MADRIGACRFCSIADGARVLGLADAPVVNSDSFFSVPSIGGFVEGWSLIVPQRHCLSLVDFYSDTGFQQFTRRVVAAVESVYGKTVVFEHGANTEGSLTSCGTDHAHLHVVPFAYRLKDLVLESGVVPWLPIVAADLKSIVGDGEFLFFSDAPLASELSGFVHRLAAPTSQFFRNLIAKALGNEPIADYKRHALLDSAASTHQRLAKALA